MEYAYEKESTFYEKIPCKLRILFGKRQCLIKTEDLFKTPIPEIGSKIFIPEDISFVIIGSNSSKEERDKIRKYFDYSKDEIIYWYSRPPYKKYEKYENFIKLHDTDHPLIKNEKYIRIN